MFERQKNFARDHIVLTAISHIAAGFGIAVVLEGYVGSGPFIPVFIGWIILGFTAIVHTVGWMR